MGAFKDWWGKSHSRYWAGYWDMEDEKYSKPEYKKSSEYLMRLSGIRRGIANFVKILTNSDIPVHFSSGQQSYTDGEKIVVISASNDPEKFDSMVGLALHEGSHVMLTQNWFKMIQAMGVTVDKNSILSVNPFIPKSIYDLGDKLKRTPKQVFNDIKLCLNFLEDRRIDAWTYEKAPGYRPYYEACYCEHFYSEFVDLALVHPAFRSPALKSYEMHLINMFSDKADPDALPGLRKIWEIVNLPHIDRYNKDTRWDAFVVKCAGVKNGTRNYAAAIDNDDTQPLILQDALKIVRTIYENAKLVPEPEMNQMSEDDQKDGEDFSDLPNYDMGDGEGEGEGDECDKDGEGGECQKCKDGTHKAKDFKLSNKPGKGKLHTMSDKELKEFLKKAMKALRKQKQFMQGNTSKENLDDSERSTMENLELSDADLREAGAEISPKAKCKVIVYRNVNKEVISHDSFPFSSNYGSVLNKNSFSEMAVRDGFKMGAILAHRLRVMNDESTITYCRQRNGKIDKRLVAELGFQNEGIFSQTHVVKMQPVMVDLSIDASGSMNGQKWQKALTLAVALAVAADKTRTMRVRINIRASGGGGTAAVAIIYDSKKDKAIKMRELFPYLFSEGGTPEGLCFEAMRKEILEDVKQTRRFFVNLSDGEPAHAWYDMDATTREGYSGEPAARHTRHQVEDIRKLGIKVLSYFITEYKQDAQQMAKNKHSLFHTMYGKDAVYIDPESVTAIAATLNRLFLQED